MEKQVVRTETAPAPFQGAPYSQAIRAGDLVFVSGQRVGGLATDVVARFLEELAKAAGLNVHVRLLEGKDTEHVLEAIFKALGAAIGQACRPAYGGEQ